MHKKAPNTLSTNSIVVVMVYNQTVCASVFVLETFIQSNQISYRYCSFGSLPFIALFETPRAGRSGTMCFAGLRVISFQTPNACGALGLGAVAAIVKSLPSPLRHNATTFRGENVSPPARICKCRSTVTVIDKPPDINRGGFLQVQPASQRNLSEHRVVVVHNI